MKRLVLLLLFAASFAYAKLPYAPEFSWTMPITNVDGSVIPLSGAGALKATNFYCTQPPLLPVKTTVAYNIILADATTWISSKTDWVRGNWECAVTVVTNGGDESELSNSVTFPIEKAAPLAPLTLQVL
jgi:hypothetical protein